MATKLKTLFVCQDCGATSPKWIGQCPECQQWNTLVEQTHATETKPSRYAGYAADGGQRAAPVALTQVDLAQQPRVATCFKELDRVLGGGMVSGSVVLIGGDPGIGKSTLLLQTVAEMAQSHHVLYVSGEESMQQIAMRAHRAQLPQDNVLLLSETQCERILTQAHQQKPQVLVVDSIQTMYTDKLQSAPGSIGQVRECAMQLVQFAKQSQTTVFLVGHVTKEGMLAGPRVLEHMVDTVLYFEGERDGRYRLLRAVKNRFGAVNELGVFAMTDMGLKEVQNPSAIFLSGSLGSVSGSVVMVVWEGSRPILVEVQALVADSALANPRRLAVGLDNNRLSMLLAILQRHGQVMIGQQDVFVNVVGGMRVSETAVDLALIAAIWSSWRDQAIPQDMVIFGEVGLAGEIRPVQSGQERLRAAAKQGFTQAIVPQANAPKKPISGMRIQPVRTLAEMIALL